MKVIYLIISIGTCFRIKQSRTTKINGAAGAHNPARFSKTGFVFLVLFMIMSSISQANLPFTGYYQGKALRVQNPQHEDGFGFCITKITVNGKPIIGNIQTNMVIVDFSSLGLKIGDPVVIVVEHALGCEPLVLNLEDLLIKNTVEIQDTGSTLNETSDRNPKIKKDL